MSSHKNNERSRGNWEKRKVTEVILVVFKYLEGIHIEDQGRHRH